MAKGAQKNQNKIWSNSMLNVMDAYNSVAYGYVCVLFYCNYYNFCYQNIFMTLHPEKKAFEDPTDFYVLLRDDGKTLF